MPAERYNKIIFGDSVSNPDILYATGFICHDPFLYFESGRQKFTVVAALEYERAVKEVKKGVRVINRDDLLKESPDKSIMVLLEAVILLYPNSRWLIPYNYPVLYARQLELLAGSENVKVIGNELFEKRAVKAKYEVKKISKAMKIAKMAMDRAVEIISSAKINNKKELVFDKKILTSEFLKAEINYEIVRNHANSHGTIAASGKQSSIPHNTGFGKIKAHTPIIIDIFPRLESSGYWGDMTRTFVKGKAPEIVCRAYEAVRDARDKAIETIKPGARPDLMHKASIEYLESKGFKTGQKDDGGYYGFFHGLGHGIGLEIHENPRVSKYSRKNLESGNVITIEPGVYYPEWGGVRLEDSLLVGDSGAVNLTNYPDNLEID